ncbi:hypothetical protein [Tomitella cavernea]|uniref:ImmA/IrrE family metallo-endopeptidase n=1 Tax=Tomitella cavernea TaxID=1387982 RepID=A0ABP9CDJ5_9ACTN|nr:hypothetical protein [Tomitella cavernea]
MSTTDEEPDERKGLDALWESALAHGRAPLSADLLQFVRGMPSIAPYNAALIGVQRPGSRFVLTARAWRKRFGRRVAPGANPLVILKPFGPVQFVYDVADVEGEPLPDEIISPFAASGPVTEDGFARFTRALPSAGIAYAESQHGPASAGALARLGTPRRRRVGDTDTELAYEMVVNRALDVNAKFATVAHELGHLYCGHLGAVAPPVTVDRRGIRTRPKDVVKDRSHLGHAAMEYEAESVSWLVCGRVGVDTPSAEYLGGLPQDGSESKVSLEAILGAVHRVESLGGGAEKLGAMIRVDAPALFSALATEVR